MIDMRRNEIGPRQPQKTVIFGTLMAGGIILTGIFVVFSRIQVDNYRLQTTVEANLASTATVKAEKTETAEFVRVFQQETGDWPTIFFDDFNNQAFGWTTSGISDSLVEGNQSIISGSYIWEATSKDDFIWWENSNADSVGNFRLTVNALLSNGSNQGNFGVLFRQLNDDNFYFFRISGNDKYSLFLLYKGNWNTLIDWTSNSSISSREKNEITIIGQENQFTFLINGQLVDEYTDSRLPIGGSGLVVGLERKNESAAYRFFDFRLQSPPTSEDPQELLINSSNMVLEAISSAKEGNLELALELMSEAQSLDPDLVISAADWNALCWYGSLWGYADNVIFTCELAVELSPLNGSVVDSRGLAYALLGNPDLAIADFQFAVDYWRDINMQGDAIATREAWILSLKKGLNPFTESLLTSLREE